MKMKRMPKGAILIVTLLVIMIVLVGCFPEDYERDNFMFADAQSYDSMEITVAKFYADGYKAYRIVDSEYDNVCYFFSGELECVSN